MLSCDRVQPTRIAVTLVAGEGQSPPSYCEPPKTLLVDVNDESDGASVTSGCSCRIEILELGFEAPAEQARDAAGCSALISH